MLRANPVFLNVWRGLLVPEPGTAQRTYFACLVLQAAALVFWWPKASLVDTLVSEQGPQPLLATVVALGLTTAYYSVRAGADELLLSGQQPLREWTLGTPLTIGRILRGSLSGHLVHTLSLLAFSAPLLAVAFAVGSGEWRALSLSLCAIVLQALSFWLAGAVIYLRIGQHGHTTYLAVRALLVAAYVAPALRLPAASHLMVSVETLGTGGYAIETIARLSAIQLFLLLHAGIVVVLTIALHVQLRRCRALHPGSPVQSSGENLPGRG